MPETIVISDDDDALSGIPDQPAAASRQFTGAALHQEPAHDSHSSDVSAADIIAAGPLGSRHAMHA